MEQTPFERIGGEWALRAIISEFVEAMCDDPMIGFFFDGVDPHRLRDKEYEMTARFLGADVPYTGKGMRAAHARHPIMGGQFDRRRQILLEAIRRHRVPADVEARWLEHVDRLRPVITRDPRGACVDPTG